MLTASMESSNSSQGRFRIKAVGDQDGLKAPLPHQGSGVADKFIPHQGFGVGKGHGAVAPVDEGQGQVGQLGREVRYG